MWMGLATVIVVAGTTWCWLRWRRGQTPATYVYRCRACAQKIRYRATRAGAKGACPRCWRHLTLPLTPQSLTADQATAPRGEKRRLKRPVRYWQDWLGIEDGAANGSKGRQAAPSQ
jgi:DNA-directed RNA polymerase subunit RPC12/RpoP